MLVDSVVTNQWHSRTLSAPQQRSASFLGNFFSFWQENNERSIQATTKRVEYLRAAVVDSQRPLLLCVIRRCIGNDRRFRNAAVQQFFRQVAQDTGGKSASIASARLWRRFHIRASTVSWWRSVGTGERRRFGCLIRCGERTVWNRGGASWHLVRRFALLTQRRRRSTARGAPEHVQRRFELVLRSVPLRYRQHLRKCGEDAFRRNDAPGEPVKTRSLLELGADRQSMWVCVKYLQGAAGQLV